MPPAVYAPKDTEHPEEVKQFLAFVASARGLRRASPRPSAPTGPYLVDGCTIPTTCPAQSRTCSRTSRRRAPPRPALEFLSPIKGPALEQITVEVGSGIRSAADGAALYDEDVMKQAQQLGLPGW